MFNFLGKKKNTVGGAYDPTTSDKSSSQYFVIDQQTGKVLKTFNTEQDRYMWYQEEYERLSGLSETGSARKQAARLLLSTDHVTEATRDALIQLKETKRKYEQALTVIAQLKQSIVDIKEKSDFRYRKVIASYVVTAKAHGFHDAKKEMQIARVAQIWKNRKTGRYEFEKYFTLRKKRAK
jgi:hypothetical protein